MNTQEVKRKLAAILSADVKGYSCLMGEDEKGTVRTLNTYKELMTGLIQESKWGHIFIYQFSVKTIA